MYNDMSGVDRKINPPSVAELDSLYALQALLILETPQEGEFFRVLLDLVDNRIDLIENE